MSASRYRSGADLERATKKDLEANGYYVVKSGGSKGLADLVALKPGEVLLIQCKVDGYLRPAEVEKIWALGMALQASVLVASWQKDGRAARVVRLRHMCYGDKRPTMVDWSPDYAMEA